MGQWIPQQVKFRDAYRNLVAVDLPQASAVEVYPNPVTSVLSIHNTTDQSLEATLVDVQGKVVAMQPIGLGQQQIQVSALSTGVYMLALRTVDGQLVKAMKVLIQD